jgi:hypothetical protein
LALWITGTQSEYLGSDPEQGPELFLHLKQDPDPGGGWILPTKALGEKYEKGRENFKKFGVQVFSFPILYWGQEET